MNTIKRGLIIRIALLVVLVEVVAFEGMGWFFADRFNNALIERTEARLKLVGEMVANNELSISALARKKLMGDMIGAPYLHGSVIGGSGLVIVSTDPGYLGRAAADVAGIDTQWLKGKGADEQFVRAPGALTVLMRIRAAETGPPLYKAVFTISTAKLDAEKRSIMLWGQLGALVFILLSSAGLIYIAQRLITRRISTSLDALSRVEDGELDVRIPVPINDELGQLQSGINSMTRKVGYLLAEYRQNTEELRQQKDLLTSIIQHAPIQVFWKDRTFRYVGCNDQFARDAGLASPEDVVGKSDYDMTWRDQAERYRADDELVMESGKSLLDYEEPQTNADGDTIWLKTSKVPLRDKEGQIVGMLGIYTDITASKQAEDQIRRLAFYDPLTELPNRRLFLDRLEHVMAATQRSGQFAALLMLDLDNFKDLNDSQGHDVGDDLLVMVAERLRKQVREADTVARLGGDEYVVIVESLGTDEPTAGILAKKVAESIRETLIRPYALRDGSLTHYNSSSIGVTLFHGHANGIDTLLKHVDVALYQAKNAGRNTVRFFNADMQAAIEERARLAMGLRASLNNRELHLYYQPQVDVDGRILGAEALLRWLPDGPEGKPVSPGVFIPLAEETGLILPIGEWVLEQGCAQLKQWQSRPETRDLTLAINVSALQFRQPDFVLQVTSQIRKAGIDCTRLKLELTESVVLGHLDEVIEQIHEIRKLGVQISLDDFGTGFSSLSYLKRLPLDQLKIDQSFVRDLLDDPNDAAIVRAILAISDSLGLSVIAEGVETEAQQAFLVEHGCVHFQGYLFGRPMPVDQWMDSFHPQLLLQ